MSGLAPLLRSPPVRKVAQTSPADTVAPQRQPDSSSHSQARRGPTHLPGRATQLLSARVQARLRVSSPGDAAEREASTTARDVMAMPQPAAAPVRAGTAPQVATARVATREPPARRQLAKSPLLRAAVAAPSTGLHRAAMPSAGLHRATIQRQGAGQPEAPPEVVRELQSVGSAGRPLPPDLRAFMEPRFRADFGPVRIHTDERAARMAARLSARAFTYGRHIFFAEGEYRPNERAGAELVAHELTHTIQQQEVIQRQHAEVRERAPAQVQRLGLSDALDYFADAANAIPGYRMFTIVLGINPINMSRVERNAANILRGIVEFIPGGNLVTRALDHYGVFERVGAWIEGEIQRLGLTGSAIRRSIDQFLDSLSWRDIFDLGGVWNRAKRIFTDPISRLITLAGSLITGILRFLREAVLRPLAGLAQNTRGYDLLKAVLGQDPITGEAVPRNADTLIGGFMKLIGQEEVWANLQRSRAVPRAWAWFQGALAGVLGFVRQIPGMIVGLITSITIEDFLPITNLFGRVIRTFGGFIGSFISWAGGQVMQLLQIIFEVVAPAVMPYIRRAAGAFRSVIQNPIGFIRNLVRAGIQGFRQFAGNFLSHLRNSLIQWLTGTLSGANIYIPQAFSLREIIKFVLSVLGLTWQNVRQKLVRVMGETAVRVLETTFDFVVTLVRDGPAAAWDKIREAISNLREMVMEQVMTFVRDRIVTAAITRLVTSLNPAGAFIQAIIAIYNTVMFLVERLRTIAQVVMSFIDSMAAIAAGNIGAAASRVERTMAGLLTLVISFLARLVGLGRVSDAVINIVNRIRAPIDRALDRVIDWIVAQVRRLGSMIGGRDARTPEEKQRDLNRAVTELRPRIEPMLQRGTSRLVMRGRFLLWKREYRLTDLAVVDGRIRASINPTADMFSTEEIALGRELEPLLQQAERLHLLAVARTPESRARLERGEAAIEAGRPVPASITQDEMVILLRREGLPVRERITIQRGAAEITLAGGRRKVEDAGPYAARHLPGILDRRRRWGYRNWAWSVNQQFEGGPGETPQTDVLRGEVEVARHRGNLPAARVGAALLSASEASGVALRVEVEVTVRGAANVVSRAELTVGRLAPMATGASAAAGTGAERSRSGPAAIAQATAVRHGSYAVIFNTLSAALRRRGDPIMKLPGRQGPALRAVGEAFNAWRDIVSPDPANRASTPAANAAANRLVEALQRFLMLLERGG